MSVKPILFNTEMVRAILDGKKTCTRRIVKGAIPDDAMWGYTMFTPKGCVSCRGVYADEYGEKFFRLPYQQGDILYVRETWCKGSWMNEKERYYYKADDNDFHCVWHPSIHMPKEAARIWLKVTDVRVERLQEITDNECIKEGIYPSNCRDCNDIFGCDVCPDEGYDEVDKFVEVWNSTIKKSDLNRYGWDANPWVWVISFERCEKPEGVKK